MCRCVPADPFTADGDSDNSTFDTNAVYLSFAGGRQFGDFVVEADLGFGFLSTDKTRTISGSPDADGDYDSSLLTAGVGIERTIDLVRDVDMLGFGSVRYTRQDDDSYTETGSDANATVGEVTTEVLEARLGLEAKKSISGVGSFIGQVGGVFRRDLGESTADVTVFSATNELTFAASDFTGGNLLLGYEKEFSTGAKLELSAELEFGSGAQGPYVKAGLNWKY
ncbi:autotransporter outer membrane beta-barrel domain-containing protein [Ruegeria arenilitoris]|uniref:autotransporter outer membrane beta-barrel domain-containing protein n=1 Tax=Ruegeria arenilitoris TaxID=1173585 RepID=UPI0034648F10